MPKKPTTLLLPIASFKEEALEKVSGLNSVEDLDVEAYLQSELSSAVSKTIRNRAKVLQTF